MASVGAVVASIAAVAPAATSVAQGSGDWGTTNYAVGQSGTCPSYSYHSGAGVIGWQANLWAAGEFSSPSSIDGAFGPDTTAKTQHWQKTKSLSPSDGCVGAASWNQAMRDSDYQGADGNSQSWKYRPIDRNKVVVWSDYMLCKYFGFRNPADGSYHYTYVATNQCTDWHSHVEPGTQVDPYS